ncbi:MAG: monovalent cation/H(+) antiporter subunit G [Nevskiaceae bacterium]|jgi:multicomponent K+:H+ antiporter subunit G|nr:monovalent cation/H(+) antiporter subunit G [Nevskiaceae bacterium]
MSADMLPPWLLLPVSLLLIFGGLLTLLGSLGLLRMKTFYQRMHPPSMGNTMGAGCVLIASMLVSSGLAGRPVVHEVLIAVFIVTTSPITAMLLMGAAVHREASQREKREP